MSDLDQLVSLCPPPAVVDRAGTGRGVGSAIPAGHLDLLNAYGTGCFDEFLWIYGVGVENKYLDIHSCTHEMRKILRQKTADEIREVLRSYGVDSSELIQWGGTDNADSLMWIPVGDPAGWPTLIIESGQLDFTVSPRSSTGVLLDLLTGALRTKVFPFDFPSENPSFSTDFIP
ncbi:hypothetical protein ACFORH_25065 [Amycolatopsis roodepoortensis]|uniref:Uncharacterized protein n=1 Tax=Amycolatopsis roodepoortensis TaxID=700274 RepID=A0ABR9LKB6_9PSEU|nr:hypothetical protein [Amycolatopsis roodepoortensis]MBE1581088.1 hypothetical protein [Amycolatopsis roodepoortensis]